MTVIEAKKGLKITLVTHIDPFYAVYNYEPPGCLRPFSVAATIGLLPISMLYADSHSGQKRPKNAVRRPRWIFFYCRNACFVNLKNQFLRPSKFSGFLSHTKCLIFSNLSMMYIRGNLDRVVVSWTLCLSHLGKKRPKNGVGHAYWPVLRCLQLWASRRSWGHFLAHVPTE